MTAEKADKTPNPQWPFDVWQRLAVLHMHISPQDFWQMGVRDWFVLCHREQSAQFTHAHLAELMQAFPDQVGNEAGNNTDNNPIKELPKNG